jgi:fatty-acyl-CoA synthase
LRAIGRHRGTISFAPSFAYDLCVRRVSERELADLDLSSWRVAGCGSEPIQASALSSFADKFKSAGFNESSLMSCYGLAEHTLAATFSRLGQRPRVDIVKEDELAENYVAVPCDAETPAGTSIVSCGDAFPGHAVRVVDDRLRDLDDRHVGEILLTGPSLMKGYLTVDPGQDDGLRGGSFHTGDLGYLVDGELYVCGRLKETIIVSGRNYYPQDIEWAVAELPGIRKGKVVAFGTAVVGGADRLVIVVGGRVVSAALARDIRRQVVDTLGVSVDAVVAVPSNAIPRTTSGKLQRARVKAAYEAGGLGVSVDWFEGDPITNHAPLSRKDEAR